MASKSSFQKKLKIGIILGSVREGRMAERVGEFIRSQLDQQKLYELDMFDPQKIELPLMKKPLHHYQDRSEAPHILKDCETRLQAIDAFIVVTAEYNHSMPPALINFMDHFGSSIFSYKPSGIVCYSPGQYGGMRAAMQLRCFLSELGTLSVSNIFGIPEVHKALDEKGNPLNDHMERGLKRMMAQLDWHAHAMKNHRDKCGVPK